MQYIAQVRVGSEDIIGKGYWLCEVVGCEVGSNQILPLAQQLWSQDAPDFKSDNDQNRRLVGRVRQSTIGSGTPLVIKKWGNSLTPCMLCFTPDRVIIYALYIKDGNWSK